MRACSVYGSWGFLSNWRVSFSIRWPLLLQSLGPRARASAVAAGRFGCPQARGIFPDTGSDPCPLDWQDIPNHLTAREVPQATHLKRGTFLVNFSSPRGCPQTPHFLRDRRQSSCSREKETLTLWLAVLQLQPGWQAGWDLAFCTVTQELCPEGQCLC